MIALAFRTALVFAALFAALALSGLAQPPRASAPPHAEAPR